MSFIDKIPFLGFGKGIVQLAIGDTEEGMEAMRQSTRSTYILGAGAVGMLAGPVGAAAAGVTAGAAWDAGESLGARKPRGVISNVDKMITAAEKDDIDTYVKETVKLGFNMAFDAQVGLAGGRASCLVGSEYA